jgi:transposase
MLREIGRGVKFPTNSRQREGGVNSEHGGGTPTAGKRQTYTAEFKLAAVKMILEQKLSVAEVARRLGVGENLLHTWKKAVLADGTKASPGSGHPTRRREPQAQGRGQAPRSGARHPKNRWRNEVRGTGSRCNRGPRLGRRYA